MKKYFIGEKGNFYKANLHTHTTLSDGKLTPEQVKAEYLKHGYSVVAFTDHNLLMPHNELTDGNFLALTAFELDVNEKVEKSFEFLKTYHINFYAENKFNKVIPITPEMRNYSVDSINAIIKLMNENGFIATYNHPVWSLQNYSDYSGLKGVWGVEVYNSLCNEVSFKDTDQPFTDFLCQGKNVVPIAADDLHVIENAFYGFTVIEAKSLTYEEVFAAMKRGDLYASTGPLIKELYIENGILTVKCSAAQKIMLNTERRRQDCVFGEGVTRADFNLNGYFEENSKYSPENTFVRITVEDKFGRKAWTRAFAEKELKN